MLLLQRTAVFTSAVNESEKEDEMEFDAPALDLPHRYDFGGQTVAWGSIGEGPPVVMIHGFPWSAQAWRNLAPWIAKTHKVYYFDMLGTGLSQKGLDQNVTESVQSDLLAELFVHWGLQRPQVVAHDFGGLCALRGHFVNGIDYGRLHLVNCVAVLPSGTKLEAHVAEHQAAFATMPIYAHEAIFRAAVQSTAYYPMRDASVDLYFKPWSDAEGQAAFYRQMAHMSHDNIREAQDRYRQPDFDVHITWGMRDPHIPWQQGREIEGLLGAKSFTPIADAAHMVQEDAPAALLGSIISKLAS